MWGAPIHGCRRHYLAECFLPPFRFVGSWDAIVALRKQPRFNPLTRKRRINGASVCNSMTISAPTRE